MVYGSKVAQARMETPLHIPWLFYNAVSTGYVMRNELGRRIFSCKCKKGKAMPVTGRGGP
jgi:hypothetical protein